MTADHPVERFEQFFARRILLRVTEPPTPVILKLLPALVLGGVGQPESLRVGDVDADRQTQLTTAFPDAVETGIVDADQLTLLVAQKEAQSLVLLQASRAESVRAVHLLDGPFSEAGLIPTGIVEVEVQDRSPRSQSFGQGLRSFEGGEFAGLSRDRAAAEVYPDAHADPVHDP